jgi:hypothetical protein
MIWQYDATVTYANDGLIRLNKFVSQIIEDFCNLFYYYYPNTSYENPPYKGTRNSKSQILALSQLLQ